MSSRKWTKMQIEPVVLVEITKLHRFYSLNLHDKHEQHKNDFYIKKKNSNEYLRNALCVL